MNKHSNFHIKKDNVFEVKELFKDISKLVKVKYRNKTSELDILDLGCASGELAYFLKNDLQSSGKVWGLDISRELIKNAKQRFGGSNVKFFAADAYNFKTDVKFDVVTMTSVLSYFDDPFPAIKNLLNLLKDDGIAVISGIFNPWNIDVKLNFRVQGDTGWENFHQFSLSRIQKFITDAGYVCRISEQIMPFDIPMKENLLRSWTVNLDGNRYMMNGLQLAYNIRILQITKK